MKKKAVLALSLSFILLVACNNRAKDEDDTSKYTNIDYDNSWNNYESQETIEKQPETTIDYNLLSEEEYKAKCTEMYNDDFFKSTPKVGSIVKAHIFTSEKYKYNSSSMQGILVEDITEKYNLAMNCLACAVMHEETKDSIVPSYFGDHIYMMFIDGAELNIDTYKTGEKLILYGEVIQNKNGVYILPKYIETEPQ